MICSNCGFQNAPGDEFCGSCGQFLAWTGEQPTPVDQQPQATEQPAPAITPGTVPPNWAASTEQPVSDQRPVVTPTPTTSAGPGTFAGGPALGTRPRLIRCAVCGTANEPTRAFCLKCGSRLGPGAQAPSSRSRVLPFLVAGAAVVVVIVLLGAGFVLLGGNAQSSAHPSQPPSTGPGTSSVAINSPLASNDAHSQAPASDEASQPASSAPSGDAGSPPVAGFSCADQQLAATAPGRWIVKSARWGHRGTADFLAIALAPGADAGATASVAATLVPLGQVASRFGVSPPASGEIALVLTFSHAVGFGGPFKSQVGYQVLDAFKVAKGDQKLVDVVIGVTGGGCYNLSSDGWTSGSRSSTELVVEIHK